MRQWRVDEVAIVAFDAAHRDDMLQSQVPGRLN